MRYISILILTIFSCTQKAEKPQVLKASMSITQTQLNNTLSPLLKDIANLKAQLSWVLAAKKKDSITYLTDKATWKSQLSTAQNTAASAMTIASKQTFLKGTMGQITILMKGDTLIFSAPETQQRLLNVEAHK